MHIKTVLFLIISIGLFLLLISVERVQKERSGHRVGEMLEEVSFKEARNQYLRYEISLHKSPAQIMEEALKKDLKIIDPQNVYLLELRDEHGK